MFRRLLLAVGLVALVGAMLPTQPVSASNNGLAAAVVTGIVDQTGTACPYDMGEPKKTEQGPVGGGAQELVKFGDVAMTGAFGNYLGVVTAPNDIEACSEANTLPFPANQLAGWGRIKGGAFEGDNAVTGKCVRGSLKVDAKGWAGDYVQVGVVAYVKFDIAYETGNLMAGDCITPKESVGEVNCVGAIAVAPIESVTGVGNLGDPVAGAIVCHPLMPSNKGGK